MVNSMLPHEKGSKTLDYNTIICNKQFLQHHNL